MSEAYYNEHDPFAAAWLRELINVNAIPPGIVDERDIQLVQPADLAGFAQCHFFAGIGGWAYALRLAGWPADRPVWTGSCPCQPFSKAGRGYGIQDSRHLWPSWFRLIRECRPSEILGEQIALAAGLAWFDIVSTDLEAEEYAVGAADIAAASVGAPHIRQRLYFVGNANGQGSFRRDKFRFSAGEESSRAASMANRVGGGAGYDLRPSWALPLSVRGMWDGGRRALDLEAEPPSYLFGDAWADLVWLPCRDGKARPTQPGLQPLAHGIPNRVGTLRGAGNAIVPQVAAAFVESYLEASR